ncbi:MAG: hypothetical protein Q8L48_11770 [Archangium sp.]|nr:hypothetical protein [Archangium sp.]
MSNQASDGTRAYRGQFRGRRDVDVLDETPTESRRPELQAGVIPQQPGRVPDEVFAGAFVVAGELQPDQLSMWIAALHQRIGEHEERLIVVG